MSKEYFWAVELTKSKPEVVLQRSVDDMKETFRTAYLLKRVVLGPVPEKDQELNVVELTTTGFEDEKHQVVICSLKATSDRPFDQCNLDLTLTSKGKLKLTKGSGPVTISGQYVVEYANEVDDEEDEEDDMEDESLEQVDEEDLEVPSPGPASKKRKTAPLKKEGSSDSEEMKPSKKPVKAAPKGGKKTAKA